MGKAGGLMAGQAERGAGGSVGPHLVRWSWIAASALGAATLAVLFYDATEAPRLWWRL